METTMETTDTLNAVDHKADQAHAKIASAAATATQSLPGASGTIDSAAAVAHNTVDGVADAAKPAAEWLLQQGKDAVDLQKKLMNEACTYVAANPWKAVAIAAAAGFMLGHLMRTRDGAR